MNEGYAFTWPPHEHPYYILPDKMCAKLSVDEEVPHLLPQDADRQLYAPPSTRCLVCGVAHASPGVQSQPTGAPGANAGVRPADVVPSEDEDLGDVPRAPALPDLYDLEHVVGRQFRWPLLVST